MRVSYNTNVVVAQLVERDVANVEVVGSSPVYHSNIGESNENR